MWQRQITYLMRVLLLPGKLTTQLLMNIIRNEMPILPSKRQVTGRWWWLSSRFLIEWQGGRMHQELPWRELLIATHHSPKDAWLTDSNDNHGGSWWGGRFWSTAFPSNETDVQRKTLTLSRSKQALSGDVQEFFYTYSLEVKNVLHPNWIYQH